MINNYIPKRYRMQSGTLPECKRVKTESRCAYALTRDLGNLRTIPHPSVKVIVCDGQGYRVTYENWNSCLGKLEAAVYPAHNNVPFIAFVAGHVSSFKGMKLIPTTEQRDRYLVCFYGLPGSFELGWYNKFQANADKN